MPEKIRSRVESHPSTRGEDRGARARREVRVFALDLLPGQEVVRRAGLTAGSADREGC